MKVLIKRGVKDRGEWKPRQRIFTPTGIFLGQPKAVKEALSSGTFPFSFFSFFFHVVEMKGKLLTRQGWEQMRAGTQTNPPR